MLQIATGEDNLISIVPVTVAADREVARQAVVFFRRTVEVHRHDIVAGLVDSMGGAHRYSAQLLVVKGSLVVAHGLDAHHDILALERGQNNEILATGAVVGYGLAVVLVDVKVDAVFKLSLNTTVD